MPTPAAPTNFLISKTGIDAYQTIYPSMPALLFGWTNNEPTATHVIQSALNGGTTWVDLVEAGQGRASMEAHGFAALGAKYRFRIRSEFTAEGTFSAWVLIAGNPLITLPVLPTTAVQINAPTGLAVASNDYRGVVLTWNDNASNEGFYDLLVTGPGLSMLLGIPHLASGQITLPIGSPILDPFIGTLLGQLDNNKTYEAMVKATGGYNQNLATDWSNTVSFTTPPPHVALTNLPTTAEVTRGSAFSFTATANTSATFSSVSGALPAGLALAGATVSGTTTAAAGTYSLGIKADNGTTNDTQTLTLDVRTPFFGFTSLPASPVCWKTVAFSFTAETNIVGDTTVTETGPLPAGLSFVGSTAGGTISGTVTAPDGTYPVTLSGAIAALGTSASGTVAIVVKTPGIVVLLKPHGSTLAPQSGPAWGTVNAPLGDLFKWDVSAQAIGPIAVGSTITLAGAPGWLAVSGTTITGTPDVSGTSAVAVTWSNGTFSGTTTLTIKVPAIHITSGNTLSVFQDEAFTLALTSMPAGVFSFTNPASVPAGIAITNTAGAYALAGTLSDVGAYSIPLTVTLGTETDAQVVLITVQPLISVSSGDTVSGWKGEPILEVLSYNGACTVSEWFLVGAPDGVVIGALDCPGPYAGTHQTVAITGTPTQGGRFDASVIAHLCCSGLPKLQRRAIAFEIADALYTPWLHANRLLYDLQFQVRGGLAERQVHSFYATPSTAGVNATVTTKDDTTPGLDVTTAKTAAVGGTPGDILSVKRGDALTLAILPRDGRAVLGTADGVTNVALAMRLPNSEDGEYLYALDATVATTADGHEYFAVALAVTSGLLDDLMDSTGLLVEPLDVSSQLRCQINGQSVSSDTFIIHIAEDV